MSEGQAGTPTAAPRTVNETWIRDRWLPALRSGEYAQDSGCLQTADNRFCCLGVACDLLVNEGRLPEWDEPELGDAYYTIEGERVYLPGSVQAFLGIDRVGPKVPIVREGCQLSLVTANDTGASFAEIADGIEDWLDRQSAGHAS